MLSEQKDMIREGHLGPLACFLENADRHWSEYGNGEAHAILSDWISKCWAVEVNPLPGLRKLDSDLRINFRRFKWAGYSSRDDEAEMESRFDCSPEASGSVLVIKGKGYIEITVE